MKFPLMFKRSKGGGAFPALGSDPNPLTASPFQPGDVDVGNLFKTRMQGMTSSDLQSVMIGYKGPVGAIALNLEIYVWESHSAAWYLVAPATTVPPDSFVNVKVPNPLAAAPLGLSQQDETNVVGSGEFFIRVLDPGAAPNGTHTIIVAGNQAG
jgi:hypothetical protein